MKAKSSIGASFESHEVHAQRPVDVQARLPRGCRDLMPAAYRHRRALTRALVECFERWGYGPVMPPLVEYYDVLGRGLTEADRRLCVRFIETNTGELVSLRSDITPQIARMVAQRAGGELDGAWVRRYCYAADVVRQSAARGLSTQAASDREQLQYHQAGVELLGDADPAADAELVALCDEALRGAGLNDFRIDLAHACIGRDLIAALALPEEVAERLRVLLARKDRAAVDALVGEYAEVTAHRRAAVALCDLFGPVEPSAHQHLGVLERARMALAGCGVDEGLERLDAVLAHLRALDDSIVSRLTIDLGEVRGFDYYTGIRLRAWARGVGRPLARGGRYDDLLGRYGHAIPATGFAIDLDALEAALEHAGLARGHGSTMPVHLVAVADQAPDRVRRQASGLARAARIRGRRAWVVIAPDLAGARAQAEAAGAGTLTWLPIHPPMRVEMYEPSDEGWRTVEDANATQQCDTDEMEQER